MRFMMLMILDGYENAEVGTCENLRVYWHHG